MKPLELLNTPSPDQPIAVVGFPNAQPRDPSAPIVAMVHGTFRRAVMLAPWTYRLAGKAEVLLFELPGHGQSLAVSPPSLDNLARAIGKALSIFAGGRPLILIGESLGALVLLKIAASDDLDIRHVIAFDPPMTMSKLWIAQSNIQRLPQHREPTAFDRELADHVFGVKIGSPELEERIYYDLVEACRAKMTIVTGDVPLFPPRATDIAPCLFDSVDRYVVRQSNPDIPIKVVEGAGHSLLTEKPDACQPIIEEIIDASGGA